MSVLILTRTGDELATRPVVEALAARGEAPVLVETDRLPLEGGLCWRGPGEGWLQVPDGPRVALAEVRAIWARRTSWAAGLREAGLPPSVARAAAGEAAHVLEAALLDTPARWFDPPAVYARARNKALQLALAEAAGLRVPRTLETNDPEAARAFVAALASEGTPTISKMFTDVRVGGGTIYTNTLSPEDVEALEGIAPCPTILQEAIRKAEELRVVVVGERVFAVSLDSQAHAGAEEDWRRQGEATLSAWRPAELSTAEQAAFLAFHDALHSNYGAADCIRTPEGELVLLENNAVGESFWLYPLVPLAEAWADLLTGAAPARPVPDSLR